MPVIGAVEVVRAGPLTTVQDLGRPGWAHLGVPRAGALDAPALRLANRLVGNPEGAAGLEVTLTGCTVRLRAAGTIAVTGARARVRVAGQDAGFAEPVPVQAGAVVELGRAEQGVRSYLAFAGGIAVDPVLGSRSTDTLAWLGPPRVVDGATLPLGPPAGPPTPVATAPAQPPPRALTLRVRLGPRADWFTDVGVLLASAYTIGPMSNRVGVRLAGPALYRAVTAELLSEGIVAGAVQVPADGQPLIFLADHPTTGGYPVAAVVDAADLPLLAQARPGTTVRFHGPQR